MLNCCAPGILPDNIRWSGSKDVSKKAVWPPTAVNCVLVSTTSYFFVFVPTILPANRRRISADDEQQRRHRPWSSLDFTRRAPCSLYPQHMRRKHRCPVWAKSGHCARAALGQFVSGAPTLKYAQKLKSTPRTFARWATMRLAIEPTSVKFPASVEAIATTSQARWGSCKFGTNDLSNNTAGTLLTTLDKTAVTPARIAVLPRC